MANKDSWDLLFQKLDNMTDEGFSKLVDELNALGDIPFAVGEAYDEIITLNLSQGDAGVYYANSAYKNRSQYEIQACADEEMAA